MPMDNSATNEKKKEYLENWYGNVSVEHYFKKYFANDDNISCEPNGNKLAKEFNNYI